MEYLKADSNFSKWMERKKVKKVLIVDQTVKRAEEILISL